MAVKGDALNNYLVQKEYFNQLVKFFTNLIINFISLQTLMKQS